MKQLHFQQKYPITVVDIAKTETPFGSVQAIADWLRERIIQTPRVQYIGTFDHFAHTRAIGGEIAPEMLRPCTAQRRGTGGASAFDRHCRPG